MQPLGHLRALYSTILLADFVAVAPEEDRRMVAVAANHGAQILLGPVREDQVEIKRGLRALPAVEDLLHDQKAHAIGKFEKLRCGRIMGCADRVATHLAQNGQLPLGCPKVESRARSE